MRRSSNLDDHVEIWVWFHNYKIRPAVKDKRGIIVPAVAIPKIPYVKGMEKWKFEKLEEYVKSFHDEDVEEWLKSGRTIAVIEVINYSKGWTAPIARKEGRIRHGKQK